MTNLRAAGAPAALPGAYVSLKLRLIIMNFLQFFIWGAWLITIGAYWFQHKQWSGTSFGAIFSTMLFLSLKKEITRAMTKRSLKWQ